MGTKRSRTLARKTSDRARANVASYRGAGGILNETWYVAVLDRNNVPAERLSPNFGTMAEALPAWIATRHRRSSLVHETTFRSIEM